MPGILYTAYSDFFWEILWEDCVQRQGIKWRYTYAVYLQLYNFSSLFFFFLQRPCCQKTAMCRRAICRNLQRHSPSQPNRKHVWQSWTRTHRPALIPLSASSSTPCHCCQWWWAFRYMGGVIKSETFELIFPRPRMNHARAPFLVCRLSVSENPSHGLLLWKMHIEVPYLIVVARHENP